MDMLKEREYIIDSKANDIPYDNKMSLGEFISDALGGYSNALTISPMPHPAALHLAYNAVIAAHARGVVIDRGDLRKKIRETEQLLDQCGQEKNRLEKDNNELRQELIRCQKLNEGLEDLLNKANNDNQGV